MVKEIGTLALVSLVASMLIGCGSQHSPSTGVAPSAVPADTTAETTDPGSVASPPGGHVPPLRECGQVLTKAGANTLLQDGLVSAVVTADVVGTPVPEHVNDVSTISSTELQNVQLVAGRYDNGVPAELVTTAKARSVLFPPAFYLLLLGSLPVEGAGRYYVGNGVVGSFEIVGRDASQRCPDPANPTQFLKSEPISLEDLKGLFASVLPT
jgi:hypothetical protein